MGNRNRQHNFHTYPDIEFDVFCSLRVQGHHDAQYVHHFIERIHFTRRSRIQAQLDFFHYLTWIFLIQTKCSVPDRKRKSPAVSVDWSKKHFKQIITPWNNWPLFTSKEVWYQHESEQKMIREIVNCNLTGPESHQLAKWDCALFTRLVF